MPDTNDKTSKKSESRWKLFARNYVADLNGTRAAIAAGYSDKTARATASRLLTKSNVQGLIEELTAERAKRLDITADRVLSELAKMAFANMEDYVKVQDGDAYVDLSKVTRDQFAAVQEITVEEYTEGRGEDKRDIKRTRFKLIDKRGSLELLGKHLKLFTEKMEHSGQIGEYRIVTNVKLPHGAEGQP